jgi:hypothetical protein
VRRAGEHVAELNDVVTRDQAGLDAVDEVAVVRGLLGEVADLANCDSA